MGALNKITNQYEYPKIAEKTSKYICPECKKDVVLRKGDVRIHHFAHKKSENPCMYYNNPGESQLHKDAKLALKTCIEHKNTLVIEQKCNMCAKKKTTTIGQLSELNSIKLEHKFIYNNSNKCADVAYLENETIKYIFEICYKHKTQPHNRPDPWYEFDAESVLNNINTNTTDNIINLQCIRNETCNECRIKKQKADEERKKQEEEEKERRRIQEEERKKREEDEEERRRLQHIKDLEYQQKMKEEADKLMAIMKIKEEKGKELLAKIRSEHKKCSKCKSYDRCKKCSERIWKKYHIINNAKI